MSGASSPYTYDYESEISKDSKNKAKDKSSRSNSDDSEILLKSAIDDGPPISESSALTASNLTNSQLIQYTVSIVSMTASALQAMLFHLLNVSGVTIFYDTYGESNDMKYVGIAPAKWSLFLWYAIVFAVGISTCFVAYSASRHLAITRKIMSATTCAYLTVSYLMSTVWLFCLDRASMSSAFAIIVVTMITSVSPSLIVSKSILTYKDAFSLLKKRWYTLFVIHLNLMAAFATWVMCYGVINYGIMLTSDANADASYVSGSCAVLLFCISILHLAIVADCTSGAVRFPLVDNVVSPSFTMFWFSLGILTNSKPSSTAVMVFTSFSCVVSAVTLLYQCYHLGSDAMKKKKIAKGLLP